MWQRVWRVIMENLEIGQQDDALASPDADDDHNDDLSDHAGEDGTTLNKRQRKMLAKSQSYSDVI